MNDISLNFQTLAIISLVYTAICCVIPILVLGVGAVIAFRRGKSFVTSFIMPDTERMQAEFDKLRERHPQKTADELVNVIIQRQSLRCGLVGAITGVAGLVTLPITLPIDIVASYRIQAAMVNFISRAYSRQMGLPNEDTMMTSIVMFGSSQLTTTGTKAAMTLLADVGERIIAKIIPFAGGIIGFVMNYASAYATGQVAAGFYSGNIQNSSRNVWQAIFRRRKDKSP